MRLLGLCVLQLDELEPGLSGAEIASRIKTKVPRLRHSDVETLRKRIIEAQRELFEKPPPAAPRHVLENSAVAELLRFSRALEAARLAEALKK